MSTQAQIDANRRNAEKSTGPRSEEGKAKSCLNRLSHGFTRSVVFIPDEERQDFNLLLADLHNEFQPATPMEEILLEKVVQNQWLSLRAVRLQSKALNSDEARAGDFPKELGLLIRYQQSSERGFYKARHELITAQKERKKSEIGFESQTPAKPPEPPRETTPKPELAIPVTCHRPVFDDPDDELDDLLNGPDGDIVKELLAEIEARRIAA